MPVPKLVVTIGLMAAQVALGMTRKTEGPRLDELDVSTSEYGTPIPRFWGIRRFEASIIWAEKLREKKKKTKGKAGKYAEYKYYGTWAVLVADQEIDTVARIWLDRRLAYDTTKAGPISLASLLADLSDSPVKIQRGKNMRIYLGTETQTPDPRIEQWCEDRYGANTCPAYRGVSYIVFENLPLEKFGNRIPQISVEAVSIKGSSFIYEVKTGGATSVGGYLSPTGEFLYQTDTTVLYVWDVAARAKILERAVNFQDHLAPAPGTLYTSGNNQLWQFSADGGGGTLLINGFNNFTSGVRWASGTVYFYPITTNETHYLYYAGTVLKDVAVDVGFPVTHVFEGPDGSAWGVGPDQFGAANLNILRIEPAAFAPSAGHVTGGGVAYGMWNGTNIVVWQDDVLYLIDPADGSIIDTAALFVDPDFPRAAFDAVMPGSVRLWLGFNEINTETLDVIRTVNPADWVGGTIASVVYDPINHALISNNGFGSHEVTWRYIDRVTSTGVDLGDIIDDVGGWCGLSGLDTSAQTQTVEGYSVTQGSGKDMIAPLLDIHDVDPRPHDFNIQFVNRGGTPSITIAASAFAREGEESRYVATITQDTDLPRKVTLTFADKNHDQQPNTVITQRPLDTLDAEREASIDLSTYVETPTNSQKFADRYHRRQWMGRQKYSNALTAQQLALEPADLRILDLDGVIVKARLTRLTLSNGRLNTEWERDDPAVHILGPGTGAEMDGRDEEVIYVPGPTKGFVKDIPLLSDADNNANPLLYYGAGPYTSAQNWPGATIYKGDADGVDYGEDWGAVDSADASEWGYATEALGDALSTVWDRGNSVNVKGYLTLSSVTEADIDADPSLNFALLGDELLNFTTATLEADGSYTLSGFKRGRRGTEWATAIHVEGEDFVLADEMANEGVGLSDVGTDLHFKAQTFARSPEGVTAIDVGFEGKSLMPYAPARLEVVFDGSDLDCEITRRTRVGGSWVGGSTIPLSENSEAYEVDVYNGATFKRTITVSGTNLFTYTAAMAAADSITLPAQPTFFVYQMSDAVGRGFALAA